MKLLKTLVIAVVIGGLLLGATVPALAAGGVTNTQPGASFAPGPDKGGKGRWWEGKVEIVRGTVTRVPSDTGAPSGVITVDNTTDIYVTANTTYKVPGLGWGARLLDITDGMYIVAQCDRMTNNELQSRYVTLVPGKSEYRYQHYTGNVTAYDPSGGSITIEEKSGKTIPFVIIAGKFNIMPPGANVTVGDWVTVIGYRESPSSPLIAVGVCVYQPRPWAGPERISGNITGIDETNKTITITKDTTSTSISYNGNTFFVLRGVLGLLSQKATIFYAEQGSNKIAKLVLVGVEDVPGILTQLQEAGAGLWKQGQGH